MSRYHEFIWHLKKERISTLVLSPISLYQWSILIVEKFFSPQKIPKNFLPNHSLWDDSSTLITKKKLRYFNFFGFFVGKFFSEISQKNKIQKKLFTEDFTKSLDFSKFLKNIANFYHSKNHSDKEKEEIDCHKLNTFH